MVGIEAPRIIPAAALSHLIDQLRARGYRVLGPRVREGSVVIDEIASAVELPRGWRDRQEAGDYRLERDPRDLYFGHNAGPQSWKQVFFPPRLRLWRAERVDGAMEVTGQDRPGGPAALLGVRSCDLRAIAIQDRVFLEGPHPDPAYAARRAGAFIVAVNCGQAASTCFCASMGTGPRAGAGHDLALTEIKDGAGHRFLVEVGSERGEELLASLPSSRAGTGDEAAAVAVVSEAEAEMQRAMVPGIADLLRDSYRSRRWDEIAERCLACGNCTLVCPTCFCSAVEDTSDLTGAAERSRRWDSCFSGQHSHIHGGSVHAGIASRYRQWMTHKLSTWVDQFGSSGCVGCGRCITWCPVGIDITEEARGFAAAAPVVGSTP